MNAIELSHVTKHFPGFTLQDLSLTVPSGTICGLVGENGAGKSTTIRLLMGALRPDSGTCTVQGAASAAPEFLSLDYSRGMRMKLAIDVAMSHAPRLLVLDEATAGLDPIIRDQVLEIFNDFTRSDNHSILISSHILSDLEKLCDYIAFLHQGRLLFCDEKDRLLEEYGIFVGTADQVNSLQDGAVVARENSSFGGVRCLVKRALVPAGWALERPTVEDIVLFLVKGAKEQ